jgi:hypothetical protein
MKGGNTDELYKDDGRKKMAESLIEQHPDVVKMTWKFNRWHHQVDYRPFKDNALKKKDGILTNDTINNYGMELKPYTGVRRVDALKNVYGDSNEND